MAPHRPAASSASTGSRTSPASVTSRRNSARSPTARCWSEIGVVADWPGPRLSVDAQLELDVAFADGDSPVYDENVPDVLLELREYVAELVGRFEPRFG